MHRLLCTVIACWTGLGLFAQTSPDTYWVEFTDKTNTPYSLSQPQEFLSQRAIDRRSAQGIPFDDLDLPVDPAYITEVLNTGAVQLVNRSKWFNGITIRTTDEQALSAIQALPFVAAVRSSRTLGVPRDPEAKFMAPPQASERDGEAEEYGPSFLQISMLNGHELHALGALGQGMLIGVLDSGFDGVDSALAFQPLRDRGGLLMTRDLVTSDGDVFQDHWHGRSVLSCMAGILEGQLIGTAPEADYVLLRTEDAASEYPVEEDHWVAGAELADSMGCDVLNTSLGYTTFDDSTMDHRYEDLDGQTLRISIAANIASRKGMVPVCSAGNNGESEWFRISAPADAIDVLTVGAVGDVENHAPFSSHGPSYDGRVKPDVCAMGWGTTILRADTDSIMSANGTSFSSPIVAGLVACLWQLHPERSAVQIMDAVRRSASFFNAPSDSLGYGVPDFAAAHAWLTMTTGMEWTAPATTQVYPSPFLDRFVLQDPALLPLTAHVAMFDMQGRAVLFTLTTVGADGLLRVEDQRLSGLADGTYTLLVEQGGRVLRHRIVKAP